MEKYSDPSIQQSRFKHCLISRAWRQEAWKARRHGEFPRRVGYVESARSAAWPFNCRYFAPRIMNPVEAIDFNARDTEYLGGDKLFPCIDFADVGPLKRSVQLDESGLSKLQDLDCLPLSGIRVLFLPQWRLYSTSRSTIQLTIEPTTWQNLLTALMIPPNVVELLHENNGGSWQHVSHCDDNQKAHGETGSEHTGPCAYHICFKTSQFELMYARHDFHSKRNLVLIMGVDLEWEIERLMSQFNGLQSVHLFHILLAVLGTWLQKLEQSRWTLDFAVLQLEQNTGIGQLFHNVQPLQRGRLSSLRNDTADAQCNIRSVGRHSLCTGELFRVLKQALPRFQALQGCQDGSLRQQILDALGQYQSQQKSQAAQAQNLSWRMDNQWSVLVALTAKDDSDVNIAMAQDARADSLLMRRMAAVSIIFLPATFLATFFSMMFFQVDSAGALSMNGNIWVYFASTSAMSLVIGLYFRFGRSCKSFAKVTLAKLQRSRQVATSDDKDRDSLKV